LAYFKKDGLDNFPFFVYNYYSFREPIIGYVRKHVPVNGSILDAGCGTGLTSILLSSMGYSVLGIDTHDDIVGLAQRNNERLGGSAEFRAIDVFEAGGKLERSFDLVYSYGLVEHFPEPQMVKAIRLMGSLGQKVLLVVPTHEDPLVEKQRTFNFKELSDLCRQANLKPIDRFGVGTGIIKWSKLLLPPIVLKRLLGRWVKCENIGIVCKSP